MVKIIYLQVLLVIRDRTPTLGTLALLGVPGCWAERYRSRAREWRSK